MKKKHLTAIDTQPTAGLSLQLHDVKRKNVH